MARAVKEMTALTQSRPRSGVRLWRSGAARSSAKSRAKVAASNTTVGSAPTFQVTNLFMERM